MLDGAEARLAVDIGGTFTDIVLDVGQDRRTRKVLTTLARPEQAVLDGMRLILADAGAHIHSNGCVEMRTPSRSRPLVIRRLGSNKGV